MLDQYTGVGVFLAVGALFVAVTLLAGKLLRPHNPYPEKLATYECGEIPVGEGQIKFHIRYYIFALIFVVFDVETVFLYPWAVVFEEMGLFGFVVMMLFIVTLVEGSCTRGRRGHCDGFDRPRGAAGHRHGSPAPPRQLEP